jgi:membrane-bound ClpP family serine protease
VWAARSDRALQAKDPVRVVARNGLILIVERSEMETSHAH